MWIMPRDPHPEDRGHGHKGTTRAAWATRRAASPGGTSLRAGASGESSTPLQGAHPRAAGAGQVEAVGGWRRSACGGSFGYARLARCARDGVGVLPRSAAHFPPPRNTDWCRKEKAVPPVGVTTPAEGSAWVPKPQVVPPGGITTLAERGEKAPEGRSGSPCRVTTSSERVDNTLRPRCPPSNELTIPSVPVVNTKKPHGCVALTYPCGYRD